MSSRGEDYSMGGVLQSTAVDNADKLGILSAGYQAPSAGESDIDERER
jgi:hypothetical protein